MQTVTTLRAIKNNATLRVGKFLPPGGKKKFFPWKNRPGK